MTGAVRQDRESGELEMLRRSQAQAWMWSEIDETLSSALRDDPVLD